jgi:hypothetical protein
MVAESLTRQVTLGPVLSRRSQEVIQLTTSYCCLPACPTAHLIALKTLLERTPLCVPLPAYVVIVRYKLSRFSMLPAPFPPPVVVAARSFTSPRGISIAITQPAWPKED